MTTYTRIAAVTGANKGIGLAIVRQLALQYPQSAFNNGPMLIYLTARNEGRGQAALEELQNDAQLKQGKALRSYGGLADIRYLTLDVDSEESIGTFANHLKEQHPDGIDFLINNAGIAMTGFDDNVVKTTLHCNYYGTLQATQQILPHVREGGRVVNMASMLGRLGTNAYSTAIIQRFLSARRTEDVSRLMEDFTSAVANGTHQKDWPSAAYSVSKAGVIGMTKTVALEHAQSGSRTLINSCCPGWVRTDMTRGGGVKTTDEGAQTPVFLALGDLHGTTGEFWRDEKVSSWEKRG